MLQNDIDQLSSNDRWEHLLRVHHNQPISVSVIIPTYNNGRFLTQALHSVLQQNFTAHELIVVDDGSTDDTQSVLLPFQEKIKYVYQENSGSAVARNTGLALAQGEYIVFLDADDLLLPEKLAEQVDFLNQNPLVGMVHSGWYLIDEEGHQIGQVSPWERAPSLDLEAWLWKKPIKMGAMMYRKHWINHVGGFDPALRQSQDTDLMLRLALAGCQAEWIKKPTMCYRKYAQSTIRRNAPAQYKYLLMVQDKAFEHPNMPAHLLEKRGRARYFSLRWVIWHIFSNGFVDELADPMQDAAIHSPYEPFDMVFDWLSYLGQHLLEVERPLTQLDAIKAQIQNMAPLPEYEWRIIDRFLPLYFQFEANSRKPHWEWWFWKTAVSEERRTAVSAEKKFHFWKKAWVPFFKNKDAQALSNLANELPNSTATEVAAFGRLCIAYEQNPRSHLGLRQFWETVQQTGLMEAQSKSILVAWQLTLFGQLALRKRFFLALKVLLYASWHTIRAPRAVKAWGDFFQTAVKYFK
ncbi:MAG: glycosyltransferase [Chloroflexota bacterium]